MKPLPANIFEIYCEDIDAGDWHPAQANYYAGFRAGAASRDGEIGALRADAAKWRVFVKRVNSPPSPTHNQWKLVEVCSMYGDEKELIYWEQIVADIAAEGKTP